MVHQQSPIRASPSTRILDRVDVPILVKILAAAKPLSVQVHPNSAFAEEGFNTLNNTVQFAGAFADPHEKIELLYALTPFTAFCGWRPVEQVRQVFDALGINGPIKVSVESEVSRRALFEYCINHEVALGHPWEHSFCNSCGRSLAVGNQRLRDGIVRLPR